MSKSNVPMLFYEVKHVKENLKCFSKGTTSYKIMCTFSSQAKVAHLFLATCTETYRSNADELPCGVQNVSIIYSLECIPAHS